MERSVCLRRLSAVPQLFSAASAIALLCVASALANAQTAAQGAAKPARPAALVRYAPTPQQAARNKWRDALLKVKGKPGLCREAAYPQTVWHNVPCNLPDRQTQLPQLSSGRILHPLDETTSGNHTALSSGSIVSATGTFPYVEYLGAAAQHPGTYTVQMNTNGFPSPLCNGTTNSGCVGIQQFVLDSSGTFYIQIWLDNYLDGITKSCPTPAASWNVYPIPTTTVSGVSCWRNSTIGSWTPVTFDQLGGMSITGEADAGGNDTITIVTGGKAQSAPVVLDNTLGLAGRWTDIDFNVYGEGGSQTAIFNSGASLAVFVSLNDGTSNAPTCTGQGIGGSSTTEHSNLTLGPCASSPKISTLNPSISFYESVPPIAFAPQPATGSGDGGNQVVIAGVGLSNNVAVKFGNTYASNVRCAQGNCTATAPPGAGQVSITVANILSPIGAEGIFSSPAAAPTGNTLYTYLPVPHGRMSPLSGPPGTTVTLTGTNLPTAPNALTVVFNFPSGNLPASLPSCSSSTQCTFGVPFPIYPYANNGNVPVTIVANGRSSSPGTFSVTPLPKPPPPPPVSCKVCRANGQTCKTVNGKTVCVGLPQ